MDLRSVAREIFHEALADVAVASVFGRKVQVRGSELLVEDRTLDLSLFRDICVIAIGKAANPMTAGLLSILRPALHPAQTLRGVVVGADTPAQPDHRLAYLLGSHPLPDESSSLAAALILEALQYGTEESLILFLISGGASAMVERPLDPVITLAELTSFHQALVHSGLSIHQMNVLRKHLSAVKGGRLAVAGGGATMCTLLVSDVPPGKPDTIGSGPTLPDSSTLDECRHLLKDGLAHTTIPASIREWFSKPDCPETPTATHPAFRKASWHILLSSDDLCIAAARSARARGFHVEIDLACDEWHYGLAADHLLGHLRRMQHGSRPACLISAGELAVPIDGPSGVGGRNQQFALLCTRPLSDWGSPAAVLSAGTDGLDGNSPAAGAVVDDTSLHRATQNGMSADEALASFNAHPLLHALGDDIITGPTGNNLRDLRVFLLA